MKHFTRLKLPAVRWFLRCMAYALFLAVTCLALLEIAYRFQWIDFYRNELNGLNHQPALQRPDTCKTLLVFGDSFSAQPFSYVDVLRDSLPGYRIINAAVPGTGILETEVMARLRLKQFPPDAVLFQVYTGNDLWDLRRTSDSPHIAFARKLYWRLSDCSLFLRYLNYRLGQYKNGTRLAVESGERKSNQPFSAENYSARERLMFLAEPDLLQNSVLASGRRSDDLDAWLLHMDALLRKLPARTQQVLIVLAPHCAQVNRWYAGNMEQIGAAPMPEAVQAVDYPFLGRVRTYFAGDARVRVVSPLSAFQQADSAGRRLYYENDPHLNKTGQELLGRWLLAYLH